MQFRIIGAHRETGAEKVLTIDAPDEKAAISEAARRGYFVAEVRRAATSFRRHCVYAATIVIAGLAVTHLVFRQLNRPSVPSNSTVAATRDRGSGAVPPPAGIARNLLAPTTTTWPMLPGGFGNPVVGPAVAPTTRTWRDDVVVVDDAAESVPTPKAMRDLSPADLFAECAPAVVTITVLDASGKEVRQGSGFVVAADGVIITNSHVVRDAFALRVSLHNGSSFTVARVGVEDKKRDLAILKVRARDLPTVSLSGDAPPRIGSKVFAIGSPLGFANTLSEGLISGIRDDLTSYPLLQTSAAISAGSSGGPLFQADGTVVGVTTASYLKGQNINLAVPSKEVRAVLQQNADRVRALGDRAYIATKSEDARPRKAFHVEDGWWLEGRRNDKIKVVVENIPKDIAANGLSQVLIQIAAEKRLRKAGLPVADAEERRGGVLYIQLSGGMDNSGDFAYYRIGVEFHAICAPEDRPTDVGIATVWDTGNVGLAGLKRMSSIDQAIEDCVDQFIADWIKANTKKE